MLLCFIPVRTMDGWATARVGKRLEEGEAFNSGYERRQDRGRDTGRKSLQSFMNKLPSDEDRRPKETDKRRTDGGTAEWICMDGNLFFPSRIAPCVPLYIYSSYLLRSISVMFELLACQRIRHLCPARINKLDWMRFGVGQSGVECDRWMDGWWDGWRDGEI